MSLTLPWIPEKGNLLSALVHEDGIGSLQSVSKELHPWIDDLLNEFKKTMKLLFF
ncbi:MAG: putative NodU family carbamoyl transferase [Polaribacter sp.]|jgi:predicted NodU family carbamoyl transferase